jgi:PAS domain S-box-containing protein
VEPGDRFRFLTVNQSFLDNLHLPEDQVVGKYVDEVIHEPLFSRVREKCHRAILEKKTIQWEEVRDSPAGKKYGDCHITAVFDKCGHPTNIIGSIHDSTGHRLMEEALRESEATARALLTAPTDSVIVIDDQGIILALNEIAASRFGKRSDDLIGIMSYDLLP